MPNASLVNFASGETSPKSRGRFDIQSYFSSARKMLNFIAEPAGPARFRPGFQCLGETRQSQVARLIPFQVNDEQAYMLEFTHLKLRVWKTNALLTTYRTFLDDFGLGMTDQATITVDSATGLANGDEVVIQFEGDVSGETRVPQVNGRRFMLANASSTVFDLSDPTTGTLVDASTWTELQAYVGGSGSGRVYEVYEVASPYIAADLADIQFAQDRNTMYLVHPGYAPRKLTVDVGEIFTLATYSRTNDPFTLGSPSVLTITGVTLGAQTIVSLAAGSVPDYSATYTIAAIVGTTELNTNSYKVAGWPGSAVRLVNATTGADIDSSGFTPYVSGGTMTTSTDNPRSVTFYEGRLIFGGTNLRPNTIFGSRAPDSDGVARYDDFTGGTNDDDAFFFSLAPSDGQVDIISWIAGKARYLLVGTFGGPYRVSGGGLDEPITPTSINARQIDSYGCEPGAPASGGRAFYVQRSGVALRGLKYDTTVEDYGTEDLTLNAEHVTYSPLTRVVLQRGRPDVVWVLREDGVLCGMTVLGPENIAGWHRHKAAGTDAKIIDLQTLPREGRNDQLWVVVERTDAEGVTRRFVEVLADEVSFPDREDFYTGDDGESTDKTAWMNAVYAKQEEYVHVDSAGTYNGKTGGWRMPESAAVVLNLSALSGDGVTLTATPDFGELSFTFFESTDVGRKLIQKPDPETGAAGAWAEIVSVEATDSVTVNIHGTIRGGTATGDPVTYNFATSDFYFDADVIWGLWNLEGEEVAVVVDGAVYSDGGLSGKYPVVTVADGHITLPVNAAVVHVGLPFEGFLQTQNLEAGGRTGPAQAKPRNICSMAIRFLNTLGAQYGTNLYHLEPIVHHTFDTIPGRPNPVFSGIRTLPYSDAWQAEEGKYVIVAQRLPLPCIVQGIDVDYETADEE